MSEIKPLSQEIKYVGLDVDDTLVPWLVPHVNALVKLSKYLYKQKKEVSPDEQTSEEDIIGEMSMIYEKHGTIDYTPVIQEMESFGEDKISRKQYTDLILGGVEVFREVRDYYSPEIEGVREMLDRLLDAKIYVFALSSAPLNKAIRRLKRHNLDSKMKLICGVRDKIKDERPIYVKTRASFGSYSGKFDKKELEIKKPDTNLSEVLGISKEEVQESCVFVGNSQMEDVGLGLGNNCVAFHADWVKFPPYFLDDLRSFSTPKLEENYVNPDPARVKAVKNYEKRYDLNHPLELLSYLGIDK